MGSERAFITARKDRVDIESKVGKTEIISPAEIQKGGGAGYWCEVLSSTINALKMLPIAKLFSSSFY